MELKADGLTAQLESERTRSNKGKLLQSEAARLDKIRKQTLAANKAARTEKAGHLLKQLMSANTFIRKLKRSNTGLNEEVGPTMPLRGHPGTDQ